MLLDSLVSGLAALDPSLKAQIGHTSGVGGLVSTHLVPAADELLGAETFVLGKRHHESGQVRRGFVPVNAGRDDAIGSVFVRQPLQGLLEERLFLFWCRFGEPFRSRRHHVFDGQDRVFAPFLRQQIPQFAHSLVRAFGDQVLIVGCALLVSIVRIPFPVAMLHRGRH